MINLIKAFGAWNLLGNIVIGGCLPKQQHYGSPGRVQTLVTVVATNESAETGNDRVGGNGEVEECAQQPQQHEGTRQETETYLNGP